MPESSLGSSGLGLTSSFSLFGSSDGITLLADFVLNVIVPLIYVINVFDCEECGDSYVSWAEWFI